MNIKAGLFLAMLIVVIMSAGCVCGADNATDTCDDSIVEDINVTFDEQMWEGNLSDINVELPQNASGEFCVKINDETIYNRTITDKSFKVPVTLPVKNPELVVSIYPPLDCKNYKVSAFYNGMDLNITKTLKIMKFSPDYNPLNFPEEILQYASSSPLMVFPRSANGTLEFYIDDKFHSSQRAKPVIYWENNPFSNLALGNHTLKVIYSKDSYYRPFNRTLNFTVTNVIINIPKTFNITHDDCISVETFKNTTGTVKIYLDGKLIKTARTQNGEYILSLEEYIKYTDRQISVVFNADGFSRTKTQPITMAYDFDVWTYGYIFGDKNTVEIMLPDTLNNNLLSVKINETEYKFVHSQGMANNVVEVDISKLGSGNYTMEVSYKGDGKYYPLKRTYNFTVRYDFHVPYDIEYKDSSKISLNLPGDAKGNLEVYIDGNLFKSQKLTGGYAEITVDCFTPGYHTVTARYTGTDYNVTDIVSGIRVAPKITLTYRFTCSEDKYVMVETPKTTAGYVIFEIDDKKHRVDIRDGIAKFSLKNLGVGEHDIYISYYGADGFEDLSNWRVVTVYKPKIKLISSQVTFKGINIKLKLLTKNNKIMPYRVVTIKFNGKTYKLKTNKKGILVFKKAFKLKTKKYSLKIISNGAKLTKKLKAKPVALKVTETGKKLIVKAFINKKIKNRIVRFKINSKTFSARTNGKGVARMSVEKPKKIKTIEATYLKNTVKI